MTVTRRPAGALAPNFLPHIRAGDPESRAPGVRFRNRDSGLVGRDPLGRDESNLTAESQDLLAGEPEVETRTLPPFALIRGSMRKPARTRGI